MPEARLFDATKPFPVFAREHLATQKMQIAEERRRLRAERAELKRRSFTSAVTSGVGQTLEMVAASLPGVPAAPQDCRVLLKPLDYVAFSGALHGPRARNPPHFSQRGIRAQASLCVRASHR